MPRRNPERLVVVCCIDANATGAAERGAVGLRLTEPYKGSGTGSPAAPAAQSVWRAAVEVGGSIYLHIYRWNRVEMLAALPALRARRRRQVGAWTWRSRPDPIPGSSSWPPPPTGGTAGKRAAPGAVRQRRVAPACKDAAANSSRSARPRRPLLVPPVRGRPFDRVGFLLFAGSSTLLLYALQRFADDYPRCLWPAILLIVGLSLAVGAVRHARMHPHPTVSLAPIAIPS